MSAPAPSGPGSWALELTPRTQDLLADNDSFGRAHPDGRIPLRHGLAPGYLQSLRKRGLATWPATVVDGRPVSFLTERGLEARAFLLIHRRRQAIDQKLERGGAPAACADAPDGTNPTGTGGDL